MWTGKPLMLLCLVLSVYCLPQSDDSSSDREEGNIPRKVLRKYRISRPTIIDQNGNPLTPPSPPKLRRLRINKHTTPSPVNSLNSGKFGGVNEGFRIPPSQSPFQIQQGDFENTAIAEPIRVVPTYRKATSSDARSALLANVHLKDNRAVDDSGKNKPVGTTRNYSRINDDGSFTFGYEGEDGSFKEETRGTDCVVRGRYGYIDPDGVRREFAYVSGNPCDPNNPDNDEDSEDSEDEEPALPSPTRITGPRRPQINPDVKQALDQPATNQPTLRLAPRFPPQQRPTPLQISQPQRNIEATTYRPNVRLQSTTPASLFFPRPISQPAAFSPFVPSPTPTGRDFDFNQEFQKIGGQQRQNQVVIPSSQAPGFFHQRPTQLTSQQQFFGHSQQQPRPATPSLQTPFFDPQRPFYSQPQPIQPSLPDPSDHSRFNFGSVHRFPNRQYFGGANAASLIQQQHRQPTLETPRSQFKPTPSIHPQSHVLNTNSLQQDVQQENYRTEVVFDPASGRHISVLVHQQPNAPNEEVTLTQRLRGFYEPVGPSFQPQSQQDFQFPGFIGPHHTNQFFGGQAQPSVGSLTGLHADAQEALNSQASSQIDAFLSNMNTPAP